MIKVAGGAAGTETFIEKFRFGIEHEFGTIAEQKQFMDFSNSTFEDFEKVVDQLPLYTGDEQTLRTGDLGIKAKRWYVEGFERFSEEGSYLYTVPKGFEIRTPICETLDQAVDTLSHDFSLWEKIAEQYSYHAAWVALNPFQKPFVPNPPLNAWELKDRSTPEEQTAHMHMLTYGPDISFSHPDYCIDKTIDIAKKLSYYSPYIVPFSFNSPFFQGKLWSGYSRRTYYRTGQRPAVLVFTDDPSKLIQSFPTLTDKARIPAEAGRIEFKAFDCPPDLELYRSLGALLIGLALDETLTGRSTVPSEDDHKLSAKYAFDSAEIYEGTREALAAAETALPYEWKAQLKRLKDMLADKRTPAHDMIDRFGKDGQIISAILG